jgi:hypothetical protein
MVDICVKSPNARTAMRGYARNHHRTDRLTYDCIGCWASSGYSVQGCAQFEQKLRQCMDAPVRSPTSVYQHKVKLTRPLAKPQHEEEQHQLPSLENVPQDCGSSQAQLNGPRHLLFVYYVYPHNGSPYETASWKEFVWLLDHWLAFIWEMLVPRPIQQESDICACDMTFFECLYQVFTRYITSVQRPRDRLKPSREGNQGGLRPQDDRRPASPTINISQSNRLLDRSISCQQTAQCDISARSALHATTSIALSASLMFQIAVCRVVVLHAVSIEPKSRTHHVISLPTTAPWPIVRTMMRRRGSARSYPCFVHVGNVLCMFHAPGLRPLDSTQAHHPIKAEVTTKGLP